MWKCQLLSTVDWSHSSCFFVHKCNSLLMMKNSISFINTAYFCWIILLFSHAHILYPCFLSPPPFLMTAVRLLTLVLWTTVAIISILREHRYMQKSKVSLAWTVELLRTILFDTVGIFQLAVSMLMYFQGPLPRQFFHPLHRADIDVTALSIYWRCWPSSFYSQISWKVSLQAQLLRIWNYNKLSVKVNALSG